VWFAQVSPDGSYLGDILFPSLVLSFGLGFAFVSVTIASVAGVQPAQAGLASGLINTSQQIGGAVGLAILATVANSRTTDVATTGASKAVALTEGFQSAFLAGAGLAVLGVILALTLISGRESRAHAEAAQAGELATAGVAA
jgi:hypothetical protein